VAGFIGYPRHQVLAVFDTPAAADQAMERLREAGSGAPEPQRYEGSSDADRFDATGARHGVLTRAWRYIQFGLMDQLPAMAWYEAALREGKVVIAARTSDRPSTLRTVEALRAAGGHYVNHFGRFATEEFTRWRGPEPRVASVMKH
jgi:hypothetical protein